ncbi:MAG: 23S rRNA (adenine(2030)-N(6))-methyltransferase RlmJ, partial [Rhodoplanes sp.]
RKWATGVYLLWYPIKDRRAAAAFTRALTTSAMPKILRAELELDAGRTKLGAAGLIIVNPPWRLDEELNVLLSSLARLLARGADGGCRVDWLRGET